MNNTAVICIANTKGGVGKTSICANLGAYFANISGQRVLLVDADVQPTLSSYYPLLNPPEAGLAELLLRGQTKGIVTQTLMPNLDIIVSNDHFGELNSRLLHAPDGRIRLRSLLRTHFSDKYDLVLIDTQGAKTVLTESAIVAADLLLSPITTQTLAAREFLRGTVSMLAELGKSSTGLPSPTVLTALLNAADSTIDSQHIAQQLREEIFSKALSDQFRLLSTIVPSMTAYKEAATLQRPAHLHEPKRPYGRKTPCAGEVIAALAGELMAILNAHVCQSAQLIGGSEKSLNQAVGS